MKHGYRGIDVLALDGLVATLKREEKLFNLRNF